MINEVNFDRQCLSNDTKPIFLLTQILRLSEWQSDRRWVVISRKHEKSCIRDINKYNVYIRDVQQIYDKMETFLDVAIEFGSNSLFILLDEPKTIENLLNKNYLKQIIISFDRNRNKQSLSNPKGLEYLVEILRGRGRLESTFMFAATGSHHTTNTKTFESYSIDEHQYKS